MRVSSRGSFENFSYKNNNKNKVQTSKETQQTNITQKKFLKNTKITLYLRSNTIPSKDPQIMNSANYAKTDCIRLHQESQLESFCNRTE